MPPLRLTAAVFLVALGPCIAARAAAQAGLPAGARLLASDAEGLRLEFSFSADSLRALDAGLLLALPGCALESADAAAPTAGGAPLLPRWRGQVALPPGTSAELSWQLLGSESLAGEPLPFPTLLPGASPEAPPREISQRDPAAYARSYAPGVRLGERRQLRDLWVQELIVEPVGFSPAGGLRLATSLRVQLRFRADPRARALGLPLRAADPLFAPVYAGALLNAEAAASGAWARRLPPALPLGPRAGAAQAALKLLTDEDGIYAVTGAQLAAWDLPLGTPLAEIALWRQRFGWDLAGQPLPRQLPEARYFLDADGDGLLDAEDRLVFVGHRLRHAAESPDALEAYGRAAAYFVGRAPALALEMASEPAWSEGDSWAQPTDFARRRAAWGESHFLANPPSALYDAANERWRRSLYYFTQPPQGQQFTLNLPLASPGVLAGSEASLALHFQGTHNTQTERVFDIAILNDGGSTDLPPCIFDLAQAIDYSATVPAGALADGDNTLRIRRSVFWTALVQDWQLDYRSRYVADHDSLAFSADGLAGPAELRVGGLAEPWTAWQLLRVGAPGTAPVRLALAALNQSGGAGAYELVFRAQLAGDERWLLAAAPGLRAPALSAAADLSLLGETAPCAALVLSHEDFLAGMQRWADWREDQGYAVRLVGSETVWDAFGGGVRSNVALQHAARFAYQQWGTAALLLVGDANKDARTVNAFAMPNFMPVTLRQEDVLGSYELVALEEWVAKFSPNAWPSLLVGRLPVGSAEELTILLDKLECYERYGDGEGCAGAGAWRGDFLHVADDCWIWEDYYVPFECEDHELQFEIGQEELRAYGEAENLPQDFRLRPFYLSAITDPWFAEHPDAVLAEVQSNLRPLLYPVFTDTLSQGWGLVSVQSHANRNQLGHEEYFKTNFGADDHLLLANAGRPFVWMLFGCHGNTFATHNEGSVAAGDCMGEKLLFLPAGRGAVASYASEGYEYLFPNVELERDLIHLLFATAAAPGAAADWRLGTLQLAGELRYGQYTSSYRYNLLGDPLTRIDRSPPRLRLFLDRQEMADGDFLPLMLPGDTLVVDALAMDETRLAAPSLGDQFAALPAERLAAWLPIHADPALLDSLLAETDTSFAALAVPVDSALAAAGQGARGWLLAAKAGYEPARDYLALSAVDQAGREGRFTLWAAKLIEAFSAAGDSLREGQWIRPAGSLRLRVRVPSPEFQPAAFTLWEDGALRPEVTAVFAADNPDTSVYHMDFDYAWRPGEHSLEVRRDGEAYDDIRLVVDTRTRLLEGLIYPNPFRGTTTFRYSLTSGVREGSLSIYTLSGRRIVHRRLDELAEGETRWLVWDGRDERGDAIANGVYLLRLVFTDLSGEELIWEDKVVRMR